METESVSQNSPFVQSLASSNSHTRKEALEKLRQYLRTHGKFSDLDLLKLWKGLFYCMWMSDRPKAQQQLARELAGLVDILQQENVLGWVKAFWETISREWRDIGALRMDKFLYLVRQYVRTTFRYISKQSWKNVSVIQKHLDIMAQIPLSPSNERIPDGLRYHMLDIYVDELENGISEDEMALAPLELLLQPVKNLKIETKSKIMRERAEETLNDERIESWRAGRAQDALGAPDAGIGDREQADKDLPENGEYESGSDEWSGIGDD